MYSAAFQSLRLGYASAIAVVIFVLALAVILGYLVRAFREEA
jgi:multiple sugar transport system permease protein/raffinose/stachyose/melibiose transport system permease protein